MANHSLRSKRAIDSKSMLSAGLLFRWDGVLLLAGLFSSVVWLASLLQDLILHFGTSPDHSSKIWLLDVDFERSVFTWISVLALFVAASILFQISREALVEKSRFRWHWCFLALIFFALSFDEFSSIHEKVSALLAARLSHTGLFYFAWAAPAGLLSLLGLAIFVPFIRSFPPRLAVLLVVSAIVFLSGAVVMEMIGGAIAEAEGVESIRYRLMANIEEGAELAGVLIFIYALLAYRELPSVVPERRSEDLR